MRDAIRRCADCAADISHRNKVAQRCEACRDIRRRRSRRGGLLREKRTCEGCGASYLPTGSLQRWCSGCVWDGASRWRMVNHGADLDQYRKDLADGRKTSTCEVCGDQFTYRFTGGKGRTRCDRDLVADLASAGRRPKCSRCGLLSNFLDENGACHRHRERGARAERSCEGCGAGFIVLMKSARRFCTSTCGNKNRRPLSKVRTCTLCEDAFAPSHPQQKYCPACGGNRGLRHRASRYGISGPELLALKSRYDGMCWICRVKPGTCVDHDHATGRVRGWLCRPCNGALHYVERLDWLTAASVYVKAGGGGDLGSAVAVGGCGAAVRATEAA
jgi:hypothetical protein